MEASEEPRAERADEESSYGDDELETYYQEPSGMTTSVELLEEPAAAVPDLALPSPDASRAGPPAPLALVTETAALAAHPTGSTSAGSSPAPLETPKTPCPPEGRPYPASATSSPQPAVLGVDVSSALAATAAPGEPELPPGWGSRMDPRHHRRFYFNKSLNISTWKRPTAATGLPPSTPTQASSAVPLTPAASLPTPASSSPSPALAAATASMRSKSLAVAAAFDSPNESPVSNARALNADSPAVPRPNSTTPPPSSQGEETPWVGRDGWIRARSTRHDRYYYYNSVTGKSCWTDPLLRAAAPRPELERPRTPEHGPNDEGDHEDGEEDTFSAQVVTSLRSPGSARGFVVRRRSTMSSHTTTKSRDKTTDGEDNDSDNSSKGHEELEDSARFDEMYMESSLHGMSGITSPTTGASASPASSMDRSGLQHVDGSPSATPPLGRSSSVTSEQVPYDPQAFQSLVFAQFPALRSAFEELERGQKRLEKEKQEHEARMLREMELVNQRLAELAASRERASSGNNPAAGAKQPAASDASTAEVDKAFVVEDEMIITNRQASVRLYPIALASLAEDSPPPAQPSPSWDLLPNLPVSTLGAETLNTPRDRASLAARSLAARQSHEGGVHVRRRTSSTLDSDLHRFSADLRRRSLTIVQRRSVARTHAAMGPNDKFPPPRASGLTRAGASPSHAAPGRISGGVDLTNLEQVQALANQLARERGDAPATAESAALQMAELERRESKDSGSSKSGSQFFNTSSLNADSSEDLDDTMDEIARSLDYAQKEAAAQQSAREEAAKATSALQEFLTYDAEDEVQLPVAFATAEVDSSSSQQQLVRSSSLGIELQQEIAREEVLNSVAEAGATTAATAESLSVDPEDLYYIILGVPPDCEESALRPAFRRQMLKHHPDKVKGTAQEQAKAADMSELIQSAFRVLSDPWEREIYDWFGNREYAVHRNVISTFRAYLVSGVEMIKHPTGFGWPHKRKIWLDKDFQTIYSYKRRILDDEMGKLGKKKSEIKTLKVQDITEIKRGRSTNVLRRSGKERKKDCYFSIVSKDRTLDLEAHSAEMATFFVARLTLLIIDLKRDRDWMIRHYDEQGSE